jgi:hypothetical protein
MIEIKVPQRAARGSPVSGSYSITGAESELLRSKGEAVAEITCSISHVAYGEQQLAGDPAGASFELKTLHKESRRFGKAPSGSFSFTLPAELPATYNGKLINAKWFVKVKIDVPLAFDKNASQELVVE